MAKNLRDILSEVAAPKGGDEQAFKDKHVAQDTPYPGKGTDDVLNARKAKKDKTKRTHMSKEEEETAYEEVDLTDAMSIVEEILDEADFIDELEEGILEDIKTISEGEDESFIELQDGTEIEVDPETASAITDVVEFLNDDNRAKFLDRLEKDQESFLRMVDFAVSMRGE